MSYAIPLVPGEYYHIFNRGINGENIFLEEKNYHYFLDLYAKYILDLVDTYAYCLLRNHFHFLIRVREQVNNKEKSVSQAFSNFFNAYAKAFNQQYDRHGGLFEKPFHRKPIQHSNYLIQAIYYIHANPVKHQFVEKIEDWPYSSFNSYLTENETKLYREEGMLLFGGRQGFNEFHRVMTLERLSLIPKDVFFE